MAEDLFSLHFNQEQSDVYEQWLDLVANKGIKRRYYNVVQSGGKAGVRYATHAVDVVSLAAALRELVSLDDLEQRILFSALSVHDINKSPDQDGSKRFGSLATKENVAKELASIGFDAFFREWRENIVAITQIVAAHADKFNTDFASGIPAAQQPEHIPNERLDLLKNIAKGVDKISVARTFGDADIVRKGVIILNRVFSREYEVAWHRVTEQRGLLTNIIHRAASDYLKDQGWHTLSLYPEGTYYLKPKSVDLPQDAGVNIARRVEQRLAEFSAQKFDDFIKPRPMGISIDAQLLEFGVPPQKVWSKVDSIIQSRVDRAAFKISTDKGDGQEDKCRERLLKVAAQADHEHQHLAKSWLEQPDLFPQTQSGMAVGELLRTYYIFLDSHMEAKLKADGFSETWHYLYDFLNVPEEARGRYEVLDKRMDRPYLVAKDFVEDAEALLEHIEGDSTGFFGADENADKPLSPIGSYALSVLHLSHLQTERAAYAENLKRYVSDNATACAYSSSPFETQEWMSVDVPKGVKVQQFSNRLPAGKRDPKRNVSPPVQAQFQLESLGFASSGKGKALYLHCMPHTFLTEPFLRALRQSLSAARDRGIAAGNLRTSEILDTLEAEQTFDLVLKPSKGGGLPLPNFPDLIGNVITLPLSPFADNDSERYLEAIPYAFLLSRFFGVKVLLTESSIPMLSKNEIGDVYLDSIPSLLRGLFKRENLVPIQEGSREGLIPEWEVYRRLHKVSRQLYAPGSKRNVLLALISSFLEGDLHVFHVADRLLEGKTRSAKNAEAAAIGVTRQVLPMIEEAVIWGGRRERI